MADAAAPARPRPAQANNDAEMAYLTQEVGRQRANADRAARSAIVQVAVIAVMVCIALQLALLFQNFACIPADALPPV
jgi:hypothetical protein